MQMLMQKWGKSCLIKVDGHNASTFFFTGELRTHPPVGFFRFSLVIFSFSA
jgi:hypothetical protein